MCFKICSKSLKESAELLEKFISVVLSFARLIMEYSEAITNLYSDGKLPQPFKDLGVSVSPDSKLKVGDVASWKDATISKMNNNIAPAGEDQDKETRTSKEMGDSRNNHILSGMSSNLTDEDLRAHSEGLFGSGDSLTGSGLVLEALKKSTNTAQL